MIPASFAYERASSVEDASRLLGEAEDAKLIAGGHSLIPMMKLRLTRPDLLVDIGRLRELSYIRKHDGKLAIGSLTRHCDVATSALLRRACSVVAEAAEGIGDLQVRHRGTIGGSVAHGHPGSDLPAVLLCLDAEFVAYGRNGERIISAGTFFKGIFETALAADEVLMEIRVPNVERGRYAKFRRMAQDWAIVGVAAAAVDDSIHVAFANMGIGPVRAYGVEEALSGGAGPADAAMRALENLSPPTDTHATSDYRRQLATVMTRDVLADL
jgi:aerobic carbon-monoxide dehydrogenase medium subunit